MNVYFIGSANDACCYVRMYMPCYANGYWADKMSLASERKTAKQIQDDLRAITKLEITCEGYVLT